MTPRPTTQKHHRPRNILRHPQPPIRIRLGQRLGPTRQLHQPARHLRRKKSGRDGRREDILGSELDGEALGEVQSGGFGGVVAEGCVFAHRADADACYAGCDDDAGGVFEGAGFAEEGSESVRVILVSEVVTGPGWYGVFLLLTANEHTLHIQLHDLLKRTLRVLVKRRPPRSPSIRKQNINLIRILLHLPHQPLDFACLHQICGDGESLALASQRVQRLARLFAGFCFARRDEDFGAAGL